MGNCEYIYDPLFFTRDSNVNHEGAADDGTVKKNFFLCKKFYNLGSRISIRYTASICIFTRWTLGPFYTYCLLRSKSIAGSLKSPVLISTNSRRGSQWCLYNTWRRMLNSKCADSAILSEVAMQCCKGWYGGWNREGRHVQHPAAYPLSR